jgi:CBS domain-containing protein
MTPMVEEDAHLAAAAYLMKHTGARTLEVLDDERTQRPVGVITEADLAEAEADGKDPDDVRVRDMLPPA